LQGGHQSGPLTNDDCDGSKGFSNPDQTVRQDTGIVVLSLRFYFLTGFFSSLLPVFPLLTDYTFERSSQVQKVDRAANLAEKYRQQHGTDCVPVVCRHEGCPGNHNYQTSKEFVCPDEDTGITIDSDIRCLVKRCNAKRCPICTKKGVKTCSGEVFPDDRDQSLEDEPTPTSKNNAFPFISRTNARKASAPFY